MCLGHKNVSDCVQKHFLSATNVSQFAQLKKHHGQQCVRNNVSSFTRALRLLLIIFTFLRGWYSSSFLFLGGCYWGSLRQHITGRNDFADGFHLESNLMQMAVVQDHSAIKSKRWLQHTVINTLVVICLWKKIRISNECTWAMDTQARRCLLPHSRV